MSLKNLKIAIQRGYPNYEKISGVAYIIKTTIKLVIDTVIKIKKKHITLLNT